LAQSCRGGRDTCDFAVNVCGTLPPVLTHICLSSNTKNATQLEPVLASASHGSFQNQNEPSFMFSTSDTSILIPDNHVKSRLCPVPKEVRVEAMTNANSCATQSICVVRPSTALLVLKHIYLSSQIKNVAGKHLCPRFASFLSSPILSEPEGLICHTGENCIYPFPWPEIL
jgi:hypothetical protein